MFRHPSIRALLGRAISLAALEGSAKGGGAIYAAALGRRARRHARSPTHRTCERPEERTVCSSRSALKGGGEGGPWGAWWVEDGAVAEQRVENAGQAAGEGDDSDVLPAPRSDVEGPQAEGLRLWRAAPEDGDGGLDQQPAHPGVAGLGDVAAALSLARAELAWHEAKVRLDLVGVAEALDIVDRGDEGGGSHGPNAGDRAQALDALIVSGDALDHRVGVRELRVEVAHHGQQGRDGREQPAGQGQGQDAVEEGLGTAGGDAVAVLAEERADEGDVPRAGADEGVTDEETAAHVALGVGEPMRRVIGAEHTGLGQGPGVPRSVFTLRVRVAYIGAKFGSATTTSWPNDSRHRATHSLSVEASIRIRARGRSPSTAAKRCGSVRIRCSISWPASVTMQIWLDCLCTAMPTWSMAGLSSPRR